MKATWYVLTLLVPALLILGPTVGCSRSTSGPDRAASPQVSPGTATPAAQSQTTQGQTARSQTGQTHTVQMPVQQEDEPSAMPLELTFKTFEVPDQISRPAPPLPEKPKK